MQESRVTTKVYLQLTECFFSIRDVNSSTNLPDLKKDDLVAFLKKSIGLH